MCECGRRRLGFGAEGGPASSGENVSGGIGLLGSPFAVAGATQEQGVDDEKVIPLSASCRGRGSSCTRVKEEEEK